MSKQISGLYHITHIENLSSILEYGILSHNASIAYAIEYKKIYDEGIVSRRELIHTPDNRPLWDYANFYFQPRNPMLYRVVSEKKRQDIIIIRVKGSIVNKDNDGIYVTDGNAAARASKFMKVNKAPLMKIAKQTDIEYWTGETSSKRKIMAEILVPNVVEQYQIDCIYTPNPSTADRVKEVVSQADLNIEVIYEPKFFFLPQWRSHLTDNVSLAKGDMFFSQMQTLTISVNTVGVMGKGLASRARYQFPDVYVQYEDLCKGKSKESTAKSGGFQDCA